MADVSATEAARNFADLLDAVERGERFTIIRRGKAVAHLEPLNRGRGGDVKSVLGAHRPDPGWASELAEIRRLFTVEERA